MIVFVHQLSEYQGRNKLDKQHEADRRRDLLGKEPVDITPANKGSFPWSQEKDLDKFENDWSMKPVKINGIFDHEKEFTVNRIYRGEKGVDVITPFYTHLGEDGTPHGILVNRGWVPTDLKDMRNHIYQTTGSVTGVLTRGQPETKYSKVNTAMIQHFNHFRLYDFALLTSLKNREEASQFCLHQVDFDENAR